MHLSKTVTLISSSDHVDILSVENAHAQARISLYGGHLLSFIPKKDNRERLWVSKQSNLNGNKAIRGGVPVCWPWFGDNTSSKASNGTLPAHGYVRTQYWHVSSCKELNGITEISLKPESAMGAGLNGTADLLLKISIGETLTIELITTNIGSDVFTFTAALHSYFDIGDISQTELIGLSGDYLDKTQNMSTYQTPSPYRFSEETDRVHLNPVVDATIVTPKFNIKINSSGHDSIVVWNPWEQKSATMTDMENSGYQSMLCVETAVTQGVSLPVNGQHQLVQIIQ